MSEATVPMVISGERSRSTADILARGKRAASGFQALGAQGGAVAMMLRNDFPHFEVSVAMGLLGGQSVPINWHYKAAEAAYILNDCQARALVIHADLLKPLAETLPKDLPLFVVETPAEIRTAYGINEADGSVPSGLPTWDHWLAKQEPWQADPVQYRSSMIYTSGTTGNPKGVVREPADAHQLELLTDLAANCFGIDATARVLVPGPMYHSAPNFYGLNALRAGAEIVLQPRFDALEMLALIAKHGVTSCHVVPTMMVRLLRLSAAEKHRFDLQSLRWIVHAAAPCPPEVKEGLIDWLGPIVYEYYGSTETGLITFCDSPSWLAHRGTVGRAIPNAEVRIYDEQGRRLGPHQEGRVYGYSAVTGRFRYHGLPEKTAEAQHEDTFTVGDIGYLDDEGYLYLCDRARDMVISGGVNIYPAEVESALIQLPGVQDCAVFGIPDAEFGERLAAVIQPLAGHTLEVATVRQQLGERLANFKVPRHIEFRGQLPREDSGKLFKRKIRDAYWQDTARRI